MALFAERSTGMDGPPRRRRSRWLAVLGCLALVACGSASSPAAPASLSRSAPPRARADTSAPPTTTEDRAPSAPPRLATPTASRLASVQAQAASTAPTAAPPTRITAPDVTVEPPPLPAIPLDDVREVARLDLPKFRELVSTGATDANGNFVPPDYARQGFTDAQEVARVTVAMPVPIMQFDVHRLHTYTPGMRVASLLTPTPQWLVPVVVDGDGRSGMVVSSYPDGTPRVGQWGWPTVESAPLVELQQRSGGHPVMITLILLEWWGPNLALVTEGQQESLIVLRPPTAVESTFSGLHVEARQPLEPEQVMPRLVELWEQDQAACPTPDASPPPAGWLPCTG